MDLTTLTEDELTELRQAADDDIVAARVRKAAVRDELARRDAAAIIASLSPAQMAAVGSELARAQSISSVGAIESQTEVGGIG